VVLVQRKNVKGQDRSTFQQPKNHNSVMAVVSTWNLLIVGGT